MNIKEMERMFILLGVCGIILFVALSFLDANASPMPEKSKDPATQRNYQAIELANMRFSGRVQMPGLCTLTVDLPVDFGSVDDYAAYAVGEYDTTAYVVCHSYRVMKRTGEQILIWGFNTGTGGSLGADTSWIQWFAEPYRE